MALRIPTVRGGENISDPKEKVIKEFDDAGNLVKKTIILDHDHQSSIELNFDKSGGVATKVKVYDDDPTSLDTRLGHFIIVAEKHSGKKLR